MNPVPAPSMAPTSTTVVKLDSGSHDFTINIGYSRSCGNGVGKYITSQIFTVGGHHWCLHYYPDGYEKDKYVSVIIESVGITCDVKVFCNVGLLDSAGGAPSAILHSGGPHVFRAPTRDLALFKFILKKDLEASNYLRDHCFTIRCNIVVIKELSDISDGLSKASINEPD